jgi:hypothetical protein
MKARLLTATATEACTLKLPGNYKCPRQLISGPGINKIIDTVRDFIQHLGPHGRHTDAGWVPIREAHGAGYTRPIVWTQHSAHCKLGGSFFKAMNASLPRWHSSLRSALKSIRYGGQRSIGSNALWPNKAQMMLGKSECP